jgi:hypothetical protein
MDVYLSDCFDDLFDAFEMSVIETVETDNDVLVIISADGELSVSELRIVQINHPVSFQDIEIGLFDPLEIAVHLFFSIERRYDTDIVLGIDLF